MLNCREQAHYSVRCADLSFKGSCVKCGGVNVVENGRVGAVIMLWPSADLMNNAV